jgi:hypothetical protein
MQNDAFVGRQAEITALRREFDLTRPSLLVVYGRRRVGKSRLLKEAAIGRVMIYFQASRETTALNTEAFKERIAAALGPSPVLAGLSDWSSILHYVATIAADHPQLIVILDEFSYLCDGDPSLPSVIQKFWDSDAPKDGNLKLVLCGSIISSMEGLLAERNPLYGRQSGVFDIRALPMRDAVTFFPQYDAESQLMAYAVFGGVPYYLEACDPTVSLRENIVALVLSTNGRLVDEPNYLLQSELREVRVYASIVHAIADGCRDSNSIKNRVFGAKDDSSISGYLNRLTSMRIIRPARSMDADPRARNTRYAIDDQLVGFWNRFVRPNLSSVALGFGEQVFEHQVEPYLSDFMGIAFEDICREHLRRHAQEFLSAPAQEVGQVWDSNFDIDVIGRLLDGTTVYGECKWWKSEVGENILDQLIERSKRTSYGKDAARKEYLLYSRIGFTNDLRRRARTDSAIHLLSTTDLLGTSKRTRAVAATKQQKRGAS